MNRHDRRKAKATGAGDDAKRSEDYHRGAQKHFAMFKHMLAKLPPEDPPRFALLPKEIGMAASLDDRALYGDDGHKLARNYTAAILISALIMFAEAEGIEPPTYMMLRAFVEETGLDSDSISVGDLGLVSLGTQGKPGIN